MTARTVTLTIQATDADGFAQSQNVGPGAVALNGVLASGLSAAHILTIGTTSDETGETCTLVGTDGNGQTITEVVALANATTVNTTNYFRRLTSATLSAAATGVTIGHTSTNGCVSEYIGITDNASPSLAFDVALGGTGTFTVQATIYDPTVQGAKWRNHATVAAASADATGNYAYPIQAIRLLATAASAPITFTVLE